MNRDFRASSALVAIPVKDEAARIVDCLTALAQQRGGAPGVLLLVNDTTDDTVRAVQGVRASLGCALRVVEHWFAPGQGTAGQARRLAMAHADRLAPEGVPLLTTDADGRVAPDWLAANLYHLRRGIDAVFGRAEIDLVEAEAIPPALRRADAEECAYAAVLDEIESLLDPDADDPWPRHTERSGASIALARAVFRQVDGVPAVALGEDRALYAALRRADARIRHAPEVRVTVSGRILGRAAGGMADTIRRRLVTPDTMLDDALEPFDARMRRISLRRMARAAFQGGRTGAFVAAAGRAGVEPAVATRLMGGSGFGAAWGVLDSALPRQRVAVTALAGEMARAVERRDELAGDAAMLAQIGYVGTSSTVS